MFRPALKSPDACSVAFLKSMFSSQFFRFVIAAAISIPFNIVARLLLSCFFGFEVAVIGAHIVGMVVAYGAMRKRVFKSSGRRVGSELSRFAVVNFISLAQTWIVSIGILALVPLSLGSAVYRESLGHIIALSTTALTSFMLHRAFSFSATRGAKPDAEWH